MPPAHETYSREHYQFGNLHRFMDSDLSRNTRISFHLLMKTMVFGRGCSSSSSYSFSSSKTSIVEATPSGSWGILTQLAGQSFVFLSPHINGRPNNVRQRTRWETLRVA